MKHQCDEKRLALIFMCTTICHFFPKGISGYHLCRPKCLLKMLVGFSGSYMITWEQDAKIKGDQKGREEKIFHLNNYRWLEMSLMRKQLYLFFVWSRLSKANLEVSLHRLQDTMQLRYLILSLFSSWPHQGIIRHLTRYRQSLSFLVSVIRL